MTKNTERWMELGFLDRKEYDSLPAQTKAELNKAFFEAQKTPSKWPEAFGAIGATSAIMLGLVFVLFSGTGDCAPLKESDSSPANQSKVSFRL